MGASTKTKLDFIIAGAEKAGTTFLSKTLALNPAIYIPDYEIRHFRDPFYPDREKIDTLLDDKENVLCGIKHPSYLGRKEVPERIFHHNSDINLIFVLRDPAERAVSSYLHYIRHGQIPLLDPNIGLNDIVRLRYEIPKYQDILEFGLYYKYLNLYRKYFDRKNMLIIEFEEMFNGRIDFTVVTDFLQIGKTEATMEKPINEGNYDWNQCVFYFNRAVMFNRYDNLMNIVGVNDHPYLQTLDPELNKVKTDLSPNPIRINPTVKQKLKDFYQEDLGHLKKSGIFKPKNW